MSDSLWTHGLQHTRPPYPSPAPGVYSNSCAMSWWCHPTISSSVTLFSSCLQSSPASGSFQMSQLFTSGGQNIGVSASASVLPMNTQDWFPLKVKSLSYVWLFATLWTVAHQTPPSIGFSRQEYWSGLPFPSPGNLPDPGIKPISPALQAEAGRRFNLWATREAPLGFPLGWTDWISHYWVSFIWGRKEAKRYYAESVTVSGK